LNQHTVLLTGVAGFLGSNLLAELLKDGYRVLGVDDLCQGDIRNIQRFLSHPDFSFHQKSILDHGAMEDLAAQAETIVHFAALKIPRYTGSLQTLEVNGFGTEIMLEAARRFSCRFLFASTDEIYGRNPDIPFNEESGMVLGQSWVNRWSTAVSKIYGEHLCFAYQEKYNLPIVVIRYSGGYGPTYQFSPLSGPQDIFIRAILQDEPVPIHGDGVQTRIFTHVSDLIDGTKKILENSSADGEIINLGSDNVISIVNLAYLLWRLSGKKGKPKLEFIPYTDFSRFYEDVRHRKIDCSKAYYLLGYSPRISIEEGMSKLIEWHRELQRK
jgi:UDP-glucose 4-epimerase